MAVRSRPVSYTHLDVYKRQESATFDGRLAAIVDWLASQPGHTLDAVVGRGGLLRAIPSGTYAVCDTMLADLRAGVRGDHASNLGGQLARALADPRGVQALIVCLLYTSRCV